MAHIDISFLDVGQGDGTVLTTSAGEMVLIDLGSKKNAEISGVDALKQLMAMLTASMWHRDSDIPLLDKLIITHGDGDHYNLVTQFMGYVQLATGKDLVVNELVIGGEIDDYNQEFRDVVIAPHAAAGTLTLFGDSDFDPVGADGTIVPRWTLAAGTVRLYLLSANYPFRVGADKNPKSVVLMVEYATPYQKVILTGDAEEITETAILGRYPPAFLRSFGLKLGHHGSQAGTSVAWLHAVQQLASFASSDMKWAHPYCATISRVVETIGAGAALYKHQWICGEGAGDEKLYRNWNDLNGFYTTMASMTDAPTLDPVDGRWYAPGLVQGVQYQLTLDDTGLMRLQDTMGNDSGPFDPARASSHKTPEQPQTFCRKTGVGGG
jgi:competence protein ComEC